MIACHCHNVTDTDITACAGELPTPLSFICDETGAGTDCGGCKALVAELAGCAAAIPENPATAVP